MSAYMLPLRYFQIIRGRGCRICVPGLPAGRVRECCTMASNVLFLSS